MKTKIMLLVALLLFSVCSFAAEEHVDIVNFDDMPNATSKDYNQWALELEIRYPELIKYEEIGRSIDNELIYVLMLSEKIDEKIKSETFKTDNMHFLYIAGEHARETVNPGIMIKMIEEYAKAYRLNEYLNTDASIDIQSILKSNVLHFIPMSNPDGHDLSKFGVDTVETEDGITAIKNVNSAEFKKWKANLAGVDLNRNYPHYMLRDGNLVLTNSEATTSLISHNPSHEFFGGFKPGSEIETQSIMNYFKRYPFRSMISYHSRGEVVYCGLSSLPADYNFYSREIGAMIESESGYLAIHNSSNNPSSVAKGFITSHFSGIYGKPSVTIETVPFKLSDPIALKSTFKKAYNDTYAIALKNVEIGNRHGYFKYRLYVDGVFIADYFNQEYAQASARLMNGKIIESEGIPKVNLGEKMTRSEALTMLLGEFVNFEEITVNALDTFKDTDGVIPTYAKNNSIVKGSQSMFRPDEFISPEEYAVMLFSVINHFETHENEDSEKNKTKESGQDEEESEIIMPKKYNLWAEKHIAFAIENGYMTASDFLWESMFFELNETH